MFVGSSVSLYNRVICYFIPANRKVLHYLKTYGFTTTTLTIHILSSSSTMASLELEQHLIDTLKPNLNVEKYGTGFHERINLGYLCI